MTQNHRMVMDESEPATIPWRRVHQRWLWGILLTAVLFRIAIFMVAESRLELFDFPDSHRYLKVARNIAAGIGPIDSPDVKAGTDPLYPFLLSSGIWLGLQDDQALMRFGRVLNMIFSIGSIWLLASFTHHLIGPSSALIAAAIFAVDPILLFFNALVLTETCYITLLVATYYGLVRLKKYHRRRNNLRTIGPLAWAAFSGMCIGTATLLRSSNLFMPLMLAPLVWYFASGEKTRRRWQPISAVACFLVVASVALMPTVIRNARLFGRFVPVRTGNGASLLEALGPWADGGPGMDRINYPPVPETADEVQRDRLFRQEAIHWAQTHTKEVITLAWAKMRRTWSITINASEYTSLVYRLMAWLTVLPVFLLAVAGLWLLRRRPADIALLLAPAAYFTLIHMAFVGSVRYRLPAMPFVFILAAITLNHILQRPMPDRVNK